MKKIKMLTLKNKAINLHLKKTKNQKYNFTKTEIHYKSLTIILKIPIFQTMCRILLASILLPRKSTKTKMKKIKQVHKKKNKK